MYKDVDEVPLGYPSAAALFSKDNDLLIFRRFRYLNVRNLLLMQAELISLETKLEKLDRSLSASATPGAPADALKSWEAFCKDGDRRKLAQNIRETLKEYSKRERLCGRRGFSHAYQMKRYCSLTRLQIYRAPAFARLAPSIVG
jgi:hypothetical protein